MNINIIAAISLNNVIGSNGTIPWDIPEDLKHFKKITTGHVVIMGRKTFESLGSKALPNRTNIVISSDNSIASDEITVYTSIEDALMHLSDREEVFLIGGYHIYKTGLPYADKLYLTVVNKYVKGDTVFPIYDQSEWKIDLKIESENKDCVFLEYSRIKGV